MRSVQQINNRRYIVSYEPPKWYKKGFIGIKKTGRWGTKAAQELAYRAVKNLGMLYNIVDVVEPEGVFTFTPLDVKQDIRDRIWDMVLLYGERGINSNELVCYMGMDCFRRSMREMRHPAEFSLAEKIGNQREVRIAEVLCIVDPLIEGMVVVKRV
jgi:hypothetical protein